MIELVRESHRLGIPEDSNLKAGMDFRLPQYRREVFLRFYEFHLRYKSHPGAVYYVMPYMASRFNWTAEQKLWYAFINGATQNPLTSWVVFSNFPELEKIDIEKMERWHRDNWRDLQYDTDRRYQKGHLVTMTQDYLSRLAGRTQEEFFGGLCKGTPRENFMPVWHATKAFHMYGRLSTFSYTEYLKIMGLPIECDRLFMEDLSGSMSHRNGMFKVLGREDLQWHSSNPSLEKHTPDMVKWATEEAETLLGEAQTRFGGESFREDVNYHTLESTLCCYKSWHRKNRRYPNVYNDMFCGRIKFAEAKGWDKVGIDFSPFWDARRETLPEHLRLEDRTPDDPGLEPIKQNWYRETGQVIMMDREFDCFSNDFEKQIVRDMNLGEAYSSNEELSSAFSVWKKKKDKLPRKSDSAVSKETEAEDIFKMFESN